MNTCDVKEVHALLDDWERLVWDGSERSRANVLRIRGDLGARIKVKTTKPVITDNEWSHEQRGLQAVLANLLPQHRDLIWSEPDLRGDWPARDYIDLLGNHYRGVILRLRQAIVTNTPGR